MFRNYYAENNNVYTKTLHFMLILYYKVKNALVYICGSTFSWLSRVHPSILKVHYIYKCALAVTCVIYSDCAAYNNIRILCSGQCLNREEGRFLSGVLEKKFVFLPYNIVKPEKICMHLYIPYIRIHVCGGTHTLMRGKKRDAAPVLYAAIVRFRRHVRTVTGRK